MRLIIGLGIVLCFAGVGCTSSPADGEGSEAGAVADSVAAGEEPETYDYTVYLTGALTDTLQGPALFGNVMQAGTKELRLLVEMQTGSDFTGGFFITLGDTSLPAPGTYELGGNGEGAAQADTGPYEIVFRRGLLINLTSSSGTLTLDTVADTLITGSFSAQLTGEVRTADVFTEHGEVMARGQFRATPGGIGFIVGL